MFFNFKQWNVGFVLQEGVFHIEWNSYLKIKRCQEIKTKTHIFRLY